MASSRVIDYPYATDMDGGASKKKGTSVRSRPRNMIGHHIPNQLPSMSRSTPPPNLVSPHMPSMPPQQQQQQTFDISSTQDVVPYQLLLRGNSPVNIRASADALQTNEKMRMLESRLGVTEKSNRALLEEVLRLQNELRVLVGRNEQAIRAEVGARSQLDNSVNMVNDLISQLAARIKAAEDKLNEENIALNSLLSHTRGVEQAVKAGQHELTARKDNYGGKILEIQAKLVDGDRLRDTLERTVYNLTDELRNMRNKLDGQQGEFQTLITDLKLRSRRLEEENKLQLDALRKHGDIQTHTDQNTSHLRAQVESRLSELRDVIVDLRGRQDVEMNERRSLEQMLQQKVNELHMALSEQNRKREEALHALDMISRERERMAEQEKVRLQARLTEIMDELNKRLVTKEIKLREELQDRTLQLEKLLQAEIDKRAALEAKMREDNEERWAALKKLSEEELHALREALKLERAKNKESVHKLDESISLLEKQLQEQKRQSDKVIAAEIKSRKDHERQTHENINHVQEKLQVATSTLQQAIGGVNGHLASHTEKMRQELKGMIEISEQGTTRGMTDLDVRMQSLKQKVGTLEQSLDTRINEATAVLAQNIRDKVESISLWQDVTSQTIRELNQGIQQLPNDIYAVEEKQKLLRSEMESRVTSEAESRIRDVENLKQELTLLSQRKQPQAVTQQDLQEVQGTVRKLAESIQTVKTVLGMKIQSEQKLRISGIEDLQTQINSLKSQRTENTRRLEDDIDDLQRKIRPLLNHPAFIKDGRSPDKEGVNRWGVYNAYRWLTWKSRLMYFKWKKSSRKPPPGPSRPSSTPRSHTGDADSRGGGATPTDSPPATGNTHRGRNTPKENAPTTPKENGRGTPKESERRTPREAGRSTPRNSRPASKNSNAGGSSAGKGQGGAKNTGGPEGGHAGEGATW